MDRAKWLADRAHPSRATRRSTRLQISCQPASVAPAFCLTPRIRVSLGTSFSLSEPRSAHSMNQHSFVLWVLTYFISLQALSKSERTGKEARCKHGWSLDSHPPRLRAWADIYTASVIFDLRGFSFADDDSDGSVNGGSPKPLSHQQHRKEKKEFPVRLNILSLTLNIYIYCDWIKDKCVMWYYKLQATFDACSGWLTSHRNLKYEVFPLLYPNVAS